MSQNTLKLILVLLCYSYTFDHLSCSEDGLPLQTRSKRVRTAASPLDEKEKTTIERKRKAASTEQEKKKIKAKPTTVDQSQATEETVKIERGKGGKDTGGGVGGFFWWVYFEERRAGKVYINRVYEEPLGEHNSIQIFLNKASQGKHIGRFAYKKACLESGYEDIYAHMKKSNIASQKAAAAAGFQIIHHLKTAQLLMHWSRKLFLKR